MSDFLLIRCVFVPPPLNRTNPAGGIGTGKQLVAGSTLNGGTVDREELKGRAVALDNGQVSVKDEDGIHDYVKGMLPVGKRALQDGVESLVGEVFRFLRPHHY